LLVAAFTSLLLPYEQATDEIRARLQPNLLDFGVAIVSGIAAAYAHARENIQKSLPGIAIAVALVPLVCVMGIGLGFAPAFKVNRGLGFSLLLTVLVSIPLYQTFMNTVIYQRIEKTVSAQTYQVNGKQVDLSDVSAHPEGDKIKILAQLHSSEPILAKDIAALRDIIGGQSNEPVVLDVSLRLVQ
jgi:hypothetical protein